MTDLPSTQICVEGLSLMCDKALTLPWYLAFWHFTGKLFRFKADFLDMPDSKLSFHIFYLHLACFSPALLYFVMRITMHVHAMCTPLNPTFV